MAEASNVTAPTQFVDTKLEKVCVSPLRNGIRPAPSMSPALHRHARQLGPCRHRSARSGREVMLFENAGLGRSTGEVPTSIPGMAAHALAFIDALGGMVAQEIALQRPSLVRKMLLVGTAPEGGEDIMHMEKPELKKITDDPNLPGLKRLVKLFFTPSASSQAAGEAFIEPISGCERREVVHFSATRGQDSGRRTRASTCYPFATRPDFGVAAYANNDDGTGITCILECVFS